MFTLKEDYTNPNVSNVAYQDPSELDAGPSATVVHDDSPIDTTPVNNGMEEIPDLSGDFDKYNDDHHEGHHYHDHDRGEFNPIEKIEVAKYNPTNITIVKYNDNFYVNLNDVKAMMKLYDCDDYDDAIDKLIDAHKDSGIDSDNIKIVMSKDDLEDLDESSTKVMEESSVQFEVY